MSQQVLVLMGSKNDFPVVKNMIPIFDKFEVGFAMHVSSAHRSPTYVDEFVLNARENGFKVIIAVAGQSAHLAGACAAKASLPVIALPIDSTPMNGVGSLFSVIQMPPHVPVAGVGINAAENAALYALQIIATCCSEHKLAEKLDAHKLELEANVRKNDAELQAQIAALKNE